VAASVDGGREKSPACAPGAKSLPYWMKRPAGQRARREEVRAQQAAAIDDRAPRCADVAGRGQAAWREPAQYVGQHVVGEQPRPVLLLRLLRLPFHLRNHFGFVHRRHRIYYTSGLRIVSSKSVPYVCTQV